MSKRILQPTNVRLSITGTYDPGTREGTVKAVFYNNDTVAADGVCQMVITEDSMNYPAPNGDQWHNHVCRDYVPDQIGTGIHIPAGGYDTVTSLHARAELGRAAVRRHGLRAEPDLHPTTGTAGSRPGEVAGPLTGLEEPRVPASCYQNVSARVNPNPGRAHFRFVAPAPEGYRLGIYALDGTLVQEFTGTNRSGETSVNWQRDGSVARGVYAWRLACGGAVASGKLVVTD